MVAVDEEPDRIAEMRRGIGSHRPAGRELRDAENGVDQREGTDDQQQLAALGGVQPQAGEEEDAGGNKVEQRLDRSLDVERQRPPDVSPRLASIWAGSSLPGQRVPKARRQRDQLQQRQEHDRSHQGQRAAARVVSRSGLPSQMSRRHRQRGKVQNHLESGKFSPAPPTASASASNPAAATKVMFRFMLPRSGAALPRNGRRTALSNW